jgi:hypothetical protein
MTLSQSDLYTLAKKAGLPDSSAKVAAAIAMAESGGDPNVHNTNASTGDDSWGLWQINMIGSTGKQRRQQFKSIGVNIDVELVDPTKNAKAMALVSQQGRDFSPWTTYKDNKYKQYLNNNVTETSTDFNQSNFQRWTGIDTTSGISNPLITINNALSKTGAWVSDSKNWIRVAYVAGGAVLAIGALIAIIGDTKAGNLAMSLTPPGKVNSVVKTVKGTP